MSDNWGVGNCADSKAFGTTMVGDQEVELIHGEHPHSRSDSSIYARFPGGRIEGFDGHRLLHEIEFKDHNYLKQSGLSGDEVRKGGTCTIKINGLVCASFFYRDVSHALLRAHHVLDTVHDHPIHIWDPEEREKLVGRKIYYRERPAVVERLIGDQGCVIIRPEYETTFPLSPYEIEDSKNGEFYKDDDGGRVKVELHSPHIWWWRK
jgi:hypothetical protein